MGHTHRWFVVAILFSWALAADFHTVAEWAFQYLRRNAQITRERLVERKVNRMFNEENDGDRRPTYKARGQMIPNIIVDGNQSDEDEDWHSVSSTTSVLDESDIKAHRAYSQGAIGQLIIYSGGVRFVRSIKRKELWRRSFLELAEMRKWGGSSVSRLPTVPSQSLELKFIDGSKMALKGMKDRDSAFNTIVGFSGLQWQSLQAKTVTESIDDDILSTS